MAKVAMIGAGSGVFARNLIRDILSFPELQDSTISLMDIDSVRLELITKAAKNVVKQHKLPAVIESTLDRREALDGADYVIVMIQVGGLEPYKSDIEIPLKYGVKQAVGDTLGPGGVFRGLRTIPVLLDICEDMEELCPDALLINYVNPMAINCWAMNEATNIRNVGLCHSVQGTSEMLARFIGAPYEEVDYLVAGINHMAWFLEFKWNGEDAYPLLFEKMNDPDIYDREVTRFEIMKHFGYFVTESPFHMSEYVPYFRKSDELIAKIHAVASWHEKANGMYLHVCLDRAKTLHQELQEMAEAADIPLQRSHEYGAQIIYAMETGTPARINGNVSNTGLITNLPYGCCVEVPCLVDKQGIQPCFVGELPAQLAALNLSNINVQQLAVNAALDGDKEALYHAVMMDPLTAAVLTLPEIRQMVDEMLEAQRQYLPMFE